ncbi:hypothetical protein EIP91_006882 [Steccherinum ochraceum]|uniref:Nitrate/nitrite transporter n=1 Tax=Steccherinum ochraceum TaxID=92696 RepID=A0A4R0RAU4_9APHY|nr:hypothetical protein EIP91_006882 [Steccherinum ochraceum]
MSTAEAASASPDFDGPHGGIEGLPHEPKLTLWQRLTTVRVNAVNRKCKTLPILNLRSQYARNFHLLSWFAFSPLIPQAVKNDLKLTTSQVGNSNIVSLCATLLVRLIVGPLVDRYGPRKIMAALLVIGAIPSGLAGTAHSAGGLYAIRFFIGILGATFVPCQAWTTVFYDKNIVGRANALVGGWGNAGGGFTFIIMIALYNNLRDDGLSPHSAWRASFAIVPVPILFFVAVMVMIFGTDHPNGAWANRHDLPAAHLEIDNSGRRVTHEHPSSDVEKTIETTVVPVSAEDPAGGDPSLKKTESQTTETTTTTAADHTPQRKRFQIKAEDVIEEESDVTSQLDVAINEKLTWAATWDILRSPLTWLPSLAYMMTFGYELAIDANLANVLFGLFRTLGQTKAGYIASIYGLLNVFTRPLGGYFGDLIYKKYGIFGKKYLMLVCGVMQGIFSIGLGVYIDHHDKPMLSVVIVLFILTAVVNEIANGVNFSLVPHCNPSSNGFMSGFVGAMGNVGGVFFALIFRFQPTPFGKAFWISGILAAAVNILIAAIPLPKH